MKWERLILLLCSICTITGCSVVHGTNKPITETENNGDSQEIVVETLKGDKFLFEVDVPNEELSLMQQVLFNRIKLGDGRKLTDFTEIYNEKDMYRTFWIVDLDHDNLNEVCLYYAQGDVLILHEAENVVNVFEVSYNSFWPVYIDGTFEGFGASANQGDFCGNASFKNGKWNYDILTWWEYPNDTDTIHYFKGPDRIEISKEEYDEIMANYRLEEVETYDFTAENILQYVK